MSNPNSQPNQLDIFTSSLDNAVAMPALPANPELIDNKGRVYTQSEIDDLAKIALPVLESSSNNDYADNWGQYTEMGERPRNRH